MYYSLTPVSRNKKLGPMPASTSARATCPTSCALKDNGCYAEFGPMSIFWSKVDRGEAGGEFDHFVKQVEQLPKRQIWRFGQAGDLPGEGEAIDRDQMIRLARSNRQRPVIAFTHKPPTPENLAILAEARTLGFPVNLSANSVEHADELSVHGHNVVVLLPQTYQRQDHETKTEYRARINLLPKHTPAGSRLAVCPATYTDTTCLRCGACASKALRDVIIGFPAHGSRRRHVSRIAEGKDTLKEAA